MLDYIHHTTNIYDHGKYVLILVNVNNVSIMLALANNDTSKKL